MLPTSTCPSRPRHPQGKHDSQLWSHRIEHYYRATAVSLIETGLGEASVVQPATWKKIVLRHVFFFHPQPYLTQRGLIMAPVIAVCAHRDESLTFCLTTVFCFPVSVFPDLGINSLVRYAINTSVLYPFAFQCPLEIDCQPCWSIGLEHPV